LKRARSPRATDDLNIAREGIPTENMRKKEGGYYNNNDEE